MASPDPDDESNSAGAVLAWMFFFCVGFVMWVIGSAKYLDTISGANWAAVSSIVLTVIFLIWIGSCITRRQSTWADIAWYKTMSSDALSTLEMSHHGLAFYRFGYFVLIVIPVLMVAAGIGTLTMDLDVMVVSVIIGAAIIVLVTPCCYIIVCRPKCLAAPDEKSDIDDGDDDSSSDSDESVDDNKSYAVAETDFMRWVVGTKEKDKVVGKAKRDGKKRVVIQC